MMWAAANVSESPRRKKGQETEEEEERRHARPSETVEAALARLTRAYSSAIQCVGALHRLPFTANDAVQEQAVRERVATAARSAFEQAILLDPLIAEYAPTWKYTFQQHHASLEPRPAPARLTSSSHRSTVRELAYLTLVNYADLLVRVIKTAEDGWKEESTETTRRLALVALCDASDIDGSDPTVWLKLASAACRLHPTKYQRLERHALEQGRTALPPTVPPNRSIVRALARLHERPMEYMSPVPTTTTPSPPLSLELPRYSWSILGRLLLRACREGSAFCVEARHYPPDVVVVSKRSAAFGSPRVLLHLSPMLTLPPTLLGNICEYMDQSSVYKFEATCRALSAAIVSARASLERSRGAREEQGVLNENRRNNATEPGASAANGAAQQGTTAGNTLTATTTTAGNTTETTTTVGVATTPAAPTMSEEPERDSTEPGRSQQRASKRVRSQLITSGKLAERKAKRNSVEFCLLAAILGCEASDAKYRAALQQQVQWDDVLPGSLRIRSLSLNDEQMTVRQRIGGREDKMDVQARLGDASLTAFVARCGTYNSGPLDILARFLSHVAWNVEEIFASDSDGSMGLTTSIVDSIDVLTNRSGFYLDPEPFWYGSRPAVSGDNRLSCSENFAVNLFHGELRLKRCERENYGHRDDGTLLSSLVPALLERMEALDSEYAHSDEDRAYIKLKTRCHWLASGFYLWWSRMSKHTVESRRAEEVAMEHIDGALQCLRQPPTKPIGSIRTPHLESMTRSEPHWKILSQSCLTGFRDELQAASVVTLARDGFIQKLSDIEKALRDAGTEKISQADQTELVEIGQGLFHRYDLSYEGVGGKHEELFEDFLSSCEDLLLEEGAPANSGDGSHSKREWTRLWPLVPSHGLRSEEIGDLGNPAILTILATCLQAGSGSKLSIVLLLSRLILTGYEQQGLLLSRISSAKTGAEGPGDDDGSSDSDGSFLSDDEMNGTDAENGKADEKRLSLICGMIQFLSEKMADIFARCLNDAEQSQYANSLECTSLIHNSFALFSQWSECVGTAASGRNVMLDFEMFLSMNMLIKSIIEFIVEAELIRKLESIYFVGLVRTIIAQVHSFGSILQPRSNKRLGRSARQKLCLDRAHFLGAVASEAAFMLSKSLATYQSGEVYPSHLIKALSKVSEHNADEINCNHVGLTLFAESLLGMWDFVTGRESRRRLVSTSNPSFDRPIAEALGPPVSVLIISLCGAAISSGCRLSPDFGTTDSGDMLCLSEFYDTDASANDWISQEEDQVNLRRRELLRAIAQAVHCIALVYDASSDKSISAFQPPTGCDRKYGPLLPLVTTRVLNSLADILLVECGGTDEGRDQRESLWVVDWPVGVRTVGQLLDSTLHRAYQSLHGFTLDQTQSSLTGDETSQVHAPESVPAAVRLYRCISRAFAGGRRSFPKAALECVISVLPEIEESERTRTLREFLFGARGNDASVQEVTALFVEGVSVNVFKSLPEWVWESSQANTGDHQLDSETADILLVRKGICRELAQGPLPVWSSSSESSKTSKSENQKGRTEERLDADRNESELAKKFDAIFNDLCYGELINSDGWYNAAQCLFMKAEVIADRLGLTKGFARSKDFHVPTEVASAFQNLTPLTVLLEAQEREYERNLEGWVPFLGNDLSIYVRHSWSSFSSLAALAQEVGSSRSQRSNDTSPSHEEHDERFREQVVREIELLYEKEKYAEWQQAWGGVFVSALRMLATRCRCIALAMALRKSTGEPIAAAKSEIAESQAIAFYTELMASQSYGFPMLVMSDHAKRQLAHAARACFQISVEAYIKPPKEDTSSDVEVMWDLQFMIGKCYEKIASTYKQEAFSRLDDLQEGQSNAIRMYEHHMKQALSCYNKSLEEAEIFEKDGGFTDAQGGGSCHGVTEVLYRLHASRLKCLLWAVRVKEDERDLAELEALRLTSTNWFQEDESHVSTDASIRDRVWTVLADIVSALAQCRRTQPFFHRSVYRYAQALMWAPVLYDPIVGTVDGSLGTVPATKSHLLRGLNSSTPCVNSAEVIMASLFEKKRSQLCAVWVTNASGSIAQSPFQVLNNSVRKYDSLRGKYLSAYIDTLRLCRRRDPLETLLQWTAATKRDLPSFFYATAKEKGQSHSLPHIREPLVGKSSARSLESTTFLRTVKRLSNSALAHVIVQQQLQQQQDSSPAADTNAFKTAYACFLRLNCTVEELEKTRAWRYGRHAISEVEALCLAYLARTDRDNVHADANDWSGGAQKTAVLKAALAKGKELYPSLDNHPQLYGKRKKPKAKKKEQESTSRKRKEPEATSTSFVVNVPEGLHTGDKFTTTVKLGDSLKTIKVTVPAGSPSKISFSLKLPRPTKDDDKADSKHARHGADE